MLLPLLALVATTTTGPVLMQLQAGSSVRFTAHQTFSSTDGEFHKFSGEFRVDRQALENSSFVVRIEAASIDTDNSSRDEHLRNPDFFDAKAYPQLVFRSTKVTASSQTEVKVQGQLSVKGKQLPVSFLMRLDWNKEAGVRATGQLTLSRRALGLDYEAPFYIPSIKDNVNIKLQAVLSPASGG